MNLNTQQKSILLSNFPELQSWVSMRERGQNTDILDSLVISLINKIKSVKGDTGEKGEKGDKGDNYELTREDINFIISVVTPKKGVHYKDGVDGKDGKNGRNGKDGIDGKDGLDGTEISPEQIVNKLNTLTNVLDSKVLKDVASKKELVAQEKRLLDGMVRVDGRIKAIDQRWHGGLGFVTTDATLTGRGTPASPLSVATSTTAGYQAPTGIVNGVNQTFIFTVAPNVISVDGGSPIRKTQSDGTVNWTGTTTIVLTIAPNFDIFGIC